MLVEKFGGSSMAQPHIVQKRIIEDDPAVVVVSAPGIDKDFEGCFSSDLGINRTTSLLLHERFADARDRALEVAERSGVGSRHISRVVDSMDSWLYQYKDNRAGRMAAGERFSAELMAASTGRELLDPLELIAIGPNHRIDQRQTVRNLLAAIDLQKKYVIGGFYGYGQSGPEVLEFGGADTTGAVVALALGAAYRNLTDVDGFYTTNPHENDDAQHIAALTYRESRILALGGSNLLHHEVARLLSNTGLPTILCSTFGDSSNETVVSRNLASSEIRSDFIGVASREVRVLDVARVGMDDEVSTMDQLQSELGRAGVSHLLSNGGPDEATMVFSREAVELDELQSVAEQSLGGAEIRTQDLGMVVVALAQSDEYALRLAQVSTAAREADSGVVPIGNLSARSVVLLTTSESRNDVERAVHQLICAPNL